MAETTTAHIVRKHLTKHMIESHGHSQQFCQSFNPYMLYQLHWHKHIAFQDEQSHPHSDKSVWMIKPSVMQEMLKSDQPRVAVDEEDVAYEDQQLKQVPCERDHSSMCCTFHAHHTYPHRSCIMR